MRLIDRIFNKSDNTCGVSYHTPTEQDFRNRAAGRWVADVELGAHAPASHVAIRPSGCVDVTSLDVHDGHWIDLGGRGGIDVTVGRI